MEMKKYIIAGIMAVALMASGCGKFVRDELINMQNEIDRLQDVVSQANESLGTLQAVVDKMAAGGFIVDVQETAYGDTTAYVLKFGYVDSNGNVVEDNNPLILRTGVDGRNGEDAEPIVVGVKYDDQEYRWFWCDSQTNEWILDSEGNRIPVDGRTPELKIEDDFWWVTFDSNKPAEKKEWKKMGPARGNPEVFSAVNALEDRVELTLASSGEVLTIMRYLPVELSLTIGDAEVGDSVPVSPGDTVTINYALTGTAAAKAMLFAGTDGRFKTSLKRLSDTTGVVKVICPAVLPEDGYIYITVNDANGRSTVRVINFIDAAAVVPDEGEESGEGEDSGEGSGEGENPGEGENSGEGSGENNQEGE